MGRDDWYRAQTWDAATEAAFEARLRRSRSGRSQYLKIQGLSLADSPRAADREVARSMFARVIEEFENHPIERMHVIDSWAGLGRSLHRDGLLDGALRSFERYRELVDASGRPSMSSSSDLAHIELLMEINTPESLDRAAALVEVQARDFDAHGTVFPVELFRHAQVAARVADRRADAAAGAHARRALRLAEDRSSPLPNHPGVGAVRCSPQEIDELHDISNRYLDIA
jgi:hypothetical protein